MLTSADAPRQTQRPSNGAPELEFGRDCASEKKWTPGYFANSVGLDSLAGNEHRASPYRYGALWEKSGRDHREGRKIVVNAGEVATTPNRLRLAL